MFESCLHEFVFPILHYIFQFLFIFSYFPFTHAGGYRINIKGKTDNIRENIKKSEVFEGTHQVDIIEVTYDKHNYEAGIVI